jgi:hypothetical protein
VLQRVASTAGSAALLGAMLQWLGYPAPSPSRYAAAIFAASADRRADDSAARDDYAGGAAPHSAQSVPRHLFLLHQNHARLRWPQCRIRILRLTTVQNVAF